MFKGFHAVHVPDTTNNMLRFIDCFETQQPIFSIHHTSPLPSSRLTTRNFVNFQELVHQIRYIRDFFITLYFVSLGLQIPIPTSHVTWLSYSAIHRDGMMYSHVLMFVRLISKHLFKSEFPSHDTSVI